MPNFSVDDFALADKFIKRDKRANLLIGQILTTFERESSNDVSCS